MKSKKGKIKRKKINKNKSKINSEILPKNNKNRNQIDNKAQSRQYNLTTHNKPPPQHRQRLLTL